MKQVVLITGASSGIGAASALEFAKRGFRVALLARRADRLNELEKKIEALGGEALVLGGDVTDAKSLDEAVKKILSVFGRLDIVVANAGFGVTGPLSKLTVEDYRRQFETNVFGVLNTLYATKDAVLEQKGILAIIGSVAGQIPVPYGTAYGMSKFAVRALALGLRGELAKKGVAVVLISPGYIATEISRVDKNGRLQEAPDKNFPKGLMVPVEKAAPAIVRGILSRRNEVVITLHGKIFVTLNRFFPGLVNQIAKRMSV